MCKLGNAEGEVFSVTEMYGAQRRGLPHRAHLLPSDDVAYESLWAFLPEEGGKGAMKGLRFSRGLEVMPQVCGRPADAGPAGS